MTLSNTCISITKKEPERKYCTFLLSVQYSMQNMSFFFARIIGTSSTTLQHFLDLFSRFRLDKRRNERRRKNARSSKRNPAGGEKRKGPDGGVVNTRSTHTRRSFLPAYDRRHRGGRRRRRKEEASSPASSCLVVLQRGSIIIVAIGKR